MIMTITTLLQQMRTSRYESNGNKIFAEWAITEFGRQHSLMLRWKRQDYKDLESYGNSQSLHNLIGLSLEILIYEREIFITNAKITCFGIDD